MKEINTIQEKIYELRGVKVMFDFDLAALYEVETKQLNQAVKRNIERFPERFMFQLTIEEWKRMWSQFVTTSNQQTRRLSNMPFVFTEHGVTMLSSVLKSKKAIQINIAVIDAFILLKENQQNVEHLKVKLQELERKYNKQFNDVFDALNYLLLKDKNDKEQQGRKRIGFRKD